jgi:hypothetical protein
MVLLISCQLSLAINEREGCSETYASIAKFAVSHTAEECSPFLRAGVPSCIGRHSESDGTASLDALNDTGIHIGHPAFRSAEIISLEEGDYAFNCTVLVSSVQAAKEARLHISDI